VQRLPQFRFRSITHRLIFGCVIAAIVIYSLSYWQMRQVVGEGLESWMIQVAQSRIEAIAAEISGILRSVEQSADLVAHTELNESKLDILQTLMAQQSNVQTVAAVPLSTSSSASRSFGLRIDHQGDYQNLSDRDLKNLFSHCQTPTTATKPFWTKPYPSNPSSESLRIIYCDPIFSPHQEQKPIMPGMLAVELTLDWLPPLVTRKLEVVNKFFQLEMRSPFVMDLQTGQWLVKPFDYSQTQSRFSQDPTTLLHRQSIWRTSLNNSNPQIMKDSQGLVVFSAFPSTSWILGIAISNAEIGVFQQRYLLIMIASMVKDMMLMCVAIALVSQQTTRPLRALITNTEEIAQGNLDTTLPLIPHRDEVGRLAKAFRHMRDALKTYIQDLQQTTAAKQKMESELSIAAQIQRSMVPKIEIAQDSNPLYEISTLFQPARVVGGDLYDFFPLGENRLCLLIGDVADKGVGAALLMARTVTLIRTMAKPTSTPHDLLSAVNKQLCINNEDCLFVTLFCCVLNLDTGSLHYASGGHDPPLRVDNRGVQYLDLETGPPLGLDEEAIFPEFELVLQPKDLIVLYTDGITEAMNPEEEMFSDARLIDTLSCYTPSNPARTIRTIQYFHGQFVANAPQSDDMTLLVLQYQPSSPFPQEMNTVECTLTINSKLTELERVNQRLGEILQQEDIPVEIIEDALLIVEEVLVNIIQHGYDNQEHNQIDLQVKISTQSLKMVFEDSGLPFNPLTELSSPDLSMDDELRSLGGLGFYLVTELADNVDYLRQDGKNILMIVKNMPLKT